MFKSFLLTAVAAVSFSGVAHAATIDVLLNKFVNPEGTGGSSISYNGGGSISPNVQLETTPLLGSIEQNAKIVSAGSSSNGSTSPTGSLFGGSYLNLGPPRGVVHFHMPSNGATFGFTWGSINPSDFVAVIDSRGDLNLSGSTYYITGQSILDVASPGAAGGLIQADVSIKSTFGNIVFASLVNHGDGNFETANFSTSAANVTPPTSVVPLPGAVVLFGLGLAGLGGLSFRKRDQLMRSPVAA